MVYRAAFVVFFLFVALLWAAMNIRNEVIPSGQLQAQINGTDEPLRHLSYVATNRNDNFLEMGLPQDLADLATKEARKLDAVKARLSKLVTDQALDIGGAFCPKPSALPQPYAALEFLVIQDAGVRTVVNARQELFEFEAQRWFNVDSNPAGLYEVYERSQTRRQDATIMAVGAALAMREQDAINHRGPWSNGFFGGGFSALEEEVPSIRQRTAEYFALMHVLTEIANQPDGICAR